MAGTRGGGEAGVPHPSLENHVAIGFLRNTDRTTPVVRQLGQNGPLVYNCLSRDVRTALCEKVSEYDQEIPQSHNADQPVAPWERATEHL